MPEVSSDKRTDAPPGPLGAYTTLRLGGSAGMLTAVTETDEAIATVRKAASAGDPTLILAGGSNVVVSDAGFAGHVLLLRTRGLRELTRDDRHVTLRVAAGEPWDAFVARTLSSGFSGLECLSGIPGSAGATPIQNVGAYGQEVAETIVAVHAYDRRADRVVAMDAAECGFAYRTSVFKHSDRWVVLEVDFRLALSAESSPIRYAELARQLGVEAGDRVPLDRARETVLKLRAGKGMVLDPDDRDTWSVGSFFTNPIVSSLPDAAMPNWPVGDQYKLPAAWLIEHAGFRKGFSAGGGVAISSKHTLALTNRGDGSTEALLGLARVIRDGVRDRFGVELHPEPVLVNCAL